MNSIFKTILVGLAATYSMTANAAEFPADVHAPTSPKIMSKPVEVSTLQPVKPSLPVGAVITVARVDGGRLIPTPIHEEEDWMFLDQRHEAKIIQMGRVRHIEFTSEVPKESQSQTNAVKEVTDIARYEGMDYVLIYGVGPDARWAGFGGMAEDMMNITVGSEPAGWDAAKAKAVLVDVESATVLGAVQVDDIEHNIGKLADEVGHLLDRLTEPQKNAENFSEPFLLEGIMFVEAY